MAWRKEQPESTATEPTGMEMVLSGRGVLLRGTSEEVGTAVLEFSTLAGEQARSIRLASIGAVAGSAYGLSATHQQYFQFSARALKLLQDHGALPATDGGYKRSFVMDAAKRFAGNLDWKEVKFSPEQALSLQTTAATLALKAAIKDVAAAVERIEGKVDELVLLVRAERLGSALGDRRTLLAAVTLLESTGTITTTDWTSIGPLGPEIMRDVERLRAHINLKLAEVKPGAMVRTRVGEAEELSEQLLRESMALLIVAEHNYGLWQQLRVAHVEKHEPTELAAVNASVRESIEQQYSADQLMIEKMSAASELLTAPTGFEGFEPIQRRRLSKLGREMDDTLKWFADQRNLDVATVHDVTYADLGESISKTGKIAGSAVQSATKAIGRGFERVRQGHSDEPDPA